MASPVRAPWRVGNQGDELNNQIMKKSRSQTTNPKGKPEGTTIQMAGPSKTGLRYHPPQSAAGEQSGGKPPGSNPSATTEVPAGKPAGTPISTAEDHQEDDGWEIVPRRNARKPPHGGPSKITAGAKTGNPSLVGVSKRSRNRLNKKQRRKDGQTSAANQGTQVHASTAQGSVRDHTFPKRAPLPSTSTAAAANDGTQGPARNTKRTRNAANRASHDVSLSPRGEIGRAHV